ncbi:MAG: hypothetical protein GX825_08320 [Syntrophomonadaceae bacterium]|nr:hypothetical protein [Syntrophomonadaceae bacterium]
MNNLARSVSILLLAGLSFGVGLWTGNNFENLRGGFNQSAVSFEKVKESMVTLDTAIISETAYGRCHHIVTSGYEEQEKLVNKTLDEVREVFPNQDGYLVWFDEDGTLVIHQRLETWCPFDESKYHLGVFKEHVAIFRGPAGIEDEVVRVTGIKAETLPAHIMEDLKAGIMEYEGEDQANLVLENLDEYE